MFNEGQNSAIYNSCGPKRDADIGGWNWRLESLQSSCSGYGSFVGGLVTAFVRHEDEIDYLARIISLDSSVNELEAGTGFGILLPESPVQYALFCEPGGNLVEKLTRRCVRKISF